MEISAVFQQRFRALVNKNAMTNMTEVEKRDEVVYHDFTSGAQTQRSEQTQHSNIMHTQLGGKVIRITPAFVSERNVDAPVACGCEWTVKNGTTRRQDRKSAVAW